MSGDGGPLPAHDRSPEAIQSRYDRVAQIVDDCPDTLEEAIHRARYLHGESGPMDESDTVYAERIANAVRAWLEGQPVDPIPMVLHCPSCGTQHIDQATAEWDNPPHRSHLCGSCGCIWRPADVPTVGVEATATCGKSDNWHGEPPLKPLCSYVGCHNWTNLDAAGRCDFHPLRDEGDLLTATPSCACPASGHLPTCPRVAAEAESLLPACNKAPLGWRCTRGLGHDGPCAAVERSAPFQGGLVERQAVLDVLADHPACCTLVRRVPHAHG